MKSNFFEMEAVHDDGISYELMSLEVPYYATERSADDHQQSINRLNGQFIKSYTTLLWHLLRYNQAASESSSGLGWM